MLTLYVYSPWLTLIWLANLYGYFLTWKGSEYIAKGRLDLFQEPIELLSTLNRPDLSSVQALVREGFWVTVVLGISVSYAAYILNVLICEMHALDRSTYSMYKPTCITSVSNDDDKDQISDSLDSIEQLIAIGANFQAFQLLFQNVLISCAYFKQVPYHSSDLFPTLY